MPLKILYNKKRILAGVETVEGSAVALTGSSVILTRNLQPVVLESDTEVIQYDGIGDDMRDSPEVGSNLRFSFSFECPLTVSGVVGTAPALKPLLLGAGFDEIASSTGVLYQHSSPSSLDSITIKVHSEKNTTKHLEYLSTGCRGKVGLDLVTGKHGILKFSFLGSYNRPTEVTAVASAYGTQKTNVHDLLIKETVTLFTLNGKPLCAKSLSIDNLSGLDIKRSLELCSGSTTTGDPVTPVAKLVFRMPDWLTEFNPWAYGETTISQQYPLVVEYGKTAGKKVNLTVDRVQPTKPKEVKLDDGTTGMELDLRLLTPVKLTFK